MASLFILPNALSIPSSWREFTTHVRNSPGDCRAVVPFLYGQHNLGFEKFKPNIPKVLDQTPCSVLPVRPTAAMEGQPGSPLPLAILCGPSKPPRRTVMGEPCSLSALLREEKDCSVDCEPPSQLCSEHGGRAIPAWKGRAFNCHLISNLCNGCQGHLTKISLGLWLHFTNKGSWLHKTDMTLLT